MTRLRLARSRTCQSMPKFRDRREPGSRQIDREIGGGEYDPHEELTGFHVIELLGVENVLPVVGEKRGNRRDDARTIRTGQGQYVLMIGHEGVDVQSG
jgi:hypothetical protein